MKLLTKAIEKRFAKMGKQSNEADPIVIFKLFDPCGRWAYYATEYNPKTRDIYGYCISGLGRDCDEWGYANLTEIESVKNKFRLHMERDRYFKEMPISKCLSEIYNENDT